MRKVFRELTECYEYKSYDEFEKHYAKMIADGYEPHSDSSTPEYYCNIKGLDHYVAKYHKRIN